jgi:hypothetical protein
MVQIATACWFSRLDPNTYARIGVSRGVPRGMAAGYRKYPKLNPGSWFMKVTPEEYKARYFDEILKLLDPQTVVNDLVRLAEGKIPTLLCWEPSGGKQWCHRGFISAWLKDSLDIDVFEVGHEDQGCGWAHPKIPPLFRKS